MGGVVYDSYTFQCGLVGSFTSPGIDTRLKGPTAFSVSSERHWQGGVNGIAKVPKRSCPQWDSNPSRTVRSPLQANALTHSAIGSTFNCCIMSQTYIPFLLYCFIIIKTKASRLWTISILLMNILVNIQELCRQMFWYFVGMNKDCVLRVQEHRWLWQ